MMFYLYILCIIFSITMMILFAKQEFNRVTIGNLIIIGVLGVLPIANILYGVFSLIIILVSNKSENKIIMKLADFWNKEIF